MSDWWTKWAGRIALVLAELWAQSKSATDGTAGTGPDATPRDRPAEPRTPDTSRPSDELESR
jgi:hypothetical protein